ncbi:peptidoglycan DD-metalloendopeptidase family protein [Borrelia sp. RT1S]|uniref:peptidoglycan DD-metalloendopeptidase family protein n=1 Tax=Borrelia sp. RT1S TaxID=2898580 RepID=UPI001E47CCC6|nr:M23 family metallopeptidase [Borrelia sp. RT1S]UGQ17065.1 M23 family metallopeptidase [Borrelia sp. RT1S]
MIIPKKGQSVGKRNRNFLFSKTNRGGFELKDFSNVVDPTRKRRSRSFGFVNFFRKPFYVINLFLALVNPKTIVTRGYKCQYFYKHPGVKLGNAFNVSLGYGFIFRLNAVIFVLILVFYLNIFSYYGSYMFLNRLSFPKDYFIDTFLYYGDQDLNQINNDLFTANGNNYEGLKKPLILKVVKHKIKPGETLSHVASRYNITSETLISYNRIKDVRNIRPNLVVNVPNMKGILHTVAKNDSLSSIAKKYNITKVDILDANNLDNEVLSLGQDLFIPGGRMAREALRDALGEVFLFPTQGVITSGYGYRPDPFTRVISFHNGIDIANAANTPIKAAKEGIVVTVGFNAGGYGKYIVISHSSGFQTLYAHLGSFAVKVGQRVARGQVIGHMGSTGYSTGNHLHFTIFKDGKTENPMKYLR